MGMAASQARYLALVARQSNCEYEGQQINQARTVLSNQTANLFNQMLGLQVPVPPSTRDFTKTQYSFTDGINASVIDNWRQLATPDDDGYNYVVDYHYEANVYKGFIKQMNDPQIQFTYTTPTTTDKTAERANVEAIYNAQKAIAAAQDTYDTAKTEYEAWKSKIAKLVTYRDSSTMENKAQITDHTTNAYTVFDKTDRTGNNRVYYSYDLIGENAKLSTASLWTDDTGAIYTEYGANRTAVTPGTKLYLASDDYSDEAVLTTKSKRTESGEEKSNFELTSTYNNYYIVEGEGGYNVKAAVGEEDTPLVYGTQNDKTKLDAYIKQWRANGINVDTSEIYFDLSSTDGDIALKSDLDNLAGVGSGLMKTLYLYHGEGNHNINDPYQSIQSATDTLSALKTVAENDYAALKLAESNLEGLNMPSYVGNTEVTSLSTLEKEDLAEIKQIMRTMDENGADISNFYLCFRDTLSIDDESYRGGIYKFERDGVTYYTTYYDLADTAQATEFMNSIDNQAKLNYYHANYVKENVYETQKAVLDTDSHGRFKSVRFEDGSQYTLNFEEITDDEAYQDAMNQYYYKSAEYDKMVRDINAKTSIIHQEDQQLELRLKQLDTERNALSSEIDAVSKVVKDNVDKSFKTFNS